ncbi:MAG TPA: glycosyltransferase family 9 protein [Ignavibacteria bacterium]|nr:glycosyltransferase family 9 protein [Ignavibacteria bacterium]
MNKRVLELIFDYPNINKVHTIEKESTRIIKEICSGNNYDIVIVVSPKFSIALGVYLGGVKYRLGTKYRWYSFLFNIQHAQHRKHSIKHEMEYNLDLLDEINCNNIKGLIPLLNVKDEYIDSIYKILSDKGIDLKTKIITIHIPTLGSAKVWSDDNFISLINLLTKEKINIILIGKDEEKSHLERILNKVIDKSHVYSITGLSLRELTALLKITKLFIGNSSGPIHIAAAVETFVIGLYSPVKVESPVRWGPLTDKKKIFVPEKDDDSRDVMDDIKVEEVFEFTQKYIKTLH